MAEALYLLKKAEVVGATVVNGLRAVICNDDDGQSAAQTIATMIALLRTAGHKLPDSYFTERVLLATASGAVGADGDYIVIRPDQFVTVTA
jgi:hypothetical protein